jgi:GNAT superfamily N-acetyltransferase
MRRLVVIEIESPSPCCPGLARLEASDVDAVSRLFARLSPLSVYRRFFSPIVHANHFASLLLRVDGHDREAVAAVDAGEIVGVAQYARRMGSYTADLAILVADGWQRQGLGTRMIAALGCRAREAGIEEFSVDVQGDNQGALNLLRRVAPGLRLRFSGGVGEGTFAVPA